MVRAISIAAALAIILLLLYYFQDQGNQTMEKYAWLPTESSPKRCPVEIIKGDFLFADGTSIYIPDHRVVNNGWGEIGSTHVVGEELKPLPAKLQLTWFSYAEDKFYAGHFDLPKEKLRALFQEGLLSPMTGEKITYDRIIVGMAPEGEVSLWLSAEAVVLEVANFKAEVAEVDWRTLLDNEEVSRSDYIQVVLDEALQPIQPYELDEDILTSGLWASYRKRYPWKPEVIGTSPSIMWIKAYNGEHEYIKFSAHEDKNIQRAVPRKIKVNWQKASGKRYTASITLDEQEIFQAFRKLATKDPAHELTLQLEISEMSNAIDVFLKDAKFILQLKHNDIQVFKVD